MKEKSSDRMCGILNDPLDVENTRRAFLGQASCAVVAVIAACGISTGDGLGFPVAAISPDAAQGEERSYPLPPTDGASIDQDSDVILARFADRVYAFSLACPHQHTALRWMPQDQRFQCPRHNAKYRPDGTYISGRLTRALDRFPLRLEGQKVVVDLSKLYHSDREKADWDSAVIVL
jgi:nitrite reductase/ring-hydroxylating ferredoxin subunit